jgi:hypothetical protein
MRFAVMDKLNVHSATPLHMVSIASGAAFIGDMAAQLGLIFVGFF